MDNTPDSSSSNAQNPDDSNQSRDAVSAHRGALEETEGWVYAEQGLEAGG